MKTTLRISCILIGFVLVMAGCVGVDTTSTDSQVVAEPETVAPSAPDGQTENKATPVEPEAEETVAEPNEVQTPVPLSLNFAQGQIVTYKVTTAVQKSVEWEGPADDKPAAFTGGRTGNHVEITFEQQVESVDAEGDAIVRITIEALKYVGRSRDNVVLDFDSTRAENADDSLAVLIGKSYKLEISPQGEVLALIDVEPLRQTVRAASSDSGTALKLLSTGQIKERHEVPALVAVQDEFVQPSQRWSRIKAFSFGRMGAKSYERVYTLAEVQPQAGGVAIVEMEAIPSAAMAEEIHKQQATNPFSAMFDNTDDYEGRLELELATGTIRRYVEEMRTEWVIVDPSAARGDAKPAALRMTATQLYRMEAVK